MVYVISKSGKPLMPTERYWKVRKLLKNGKAKVVKRTPFTIQLLYESEENTQPISLGVDTGSKYIGLSATTKEKVLFESVVELRTDIVNNISTRREQRRTRRNRKTRYRESRFLNRVKTKKPGWIAPSIRSKIETHCYSIKKVFDILPISLLTVEVADFDIQLLQNPDISGNQYQSGPMLGFWNTREYVLYRDNHECQHCHGKSKDPILNVHHKISRKVGGNSPSNLVTLCETCHKDYHAGKINLNITSSKSYKDATSMGIMKPILLKVLNKIYPGFNTTFGYITKYTRITNGLLKEHYIDARCISGNPSAKSDNTYYYQKKVRCHNRQIHKMTIGKGGKRKNNQVPFEIIGFRLFDKVRYQGKEYFIFGRRASGFFDIRDLSGNKVNKGSISYKKLSLLEKRKTVLIEKRAI